MGECVNRLIDLNNRRVAIEEQLFALEMCNSPDNYDERLRVSARMKLMRDAWERVNIEYRRELAKVSTDDLIALATALPPPPNTGKGEGV